MKVLVVEDSERLRRSLEHGLRHAGFAVDLAADGEQGLAFALHGGHDVVVLDLMLPRLDGLALLRRLRERGSKAHVLVLSAKDRVDERIEGLQAGADDYLVKPFEFDELVARIRALVRRKYASKSPVERLGPIEVDTAKRTVSREGREIDLSRAEFAVLEHLLARRGHVVPKADLFERLYDVDGRGSDNAVEVFVHQLRKKLRVDGRPDAIRTRRGHGYLIE
jgi:two-component system copper resistance phosphate regulon response regulator CusR